MSIPCRPRWCYLGEVSSHTVRSALTDLPPPVEPPERRTGTVPRRARTLGGTLGVTTIGALLPGSGFLFARRRLLGLLILGFTLAGLGAAVWWVGLDLRSALELATDPTRLKSAAVALGVVLLLWACVVYLTYRQVRPESRPRWHTVVGNLFVLVLCLAVGAPLAVAARYAVVQADLVETVFEDNASATMPTAATEEDPWAGQARVNVLLLGSDGSETRSGVRTDTVILVSIETATGRTTMLSLPRNMMNAQFPESSPLHDLYPTGYSGYGDPAYYMLNAIYGQVPERHPGVLGASTNEGADAIKQAVEGSLGLPVDYYVMVNLLGFRQVVDAIGGITVNVNEPVAIQGDTDLGIPPTGYIEPGPDQHLDGFHALWFARGRWGSDDYERMERQRCAVAAIIDAADPATLLRRYTSLAAAGKEIVSTDIPQKLLPDFVELGLRVKDAKLKSVVFESSEQFYSGDPDFEWMRETAAKAIDPPPRDDRPKSDPGRAQDTEDQCAYQPTSS
jgi:LCP family protein required for cell wall assembly